MKAIRFLARWGTIIMAGFGAQMLSEKANLHYPWPKDWVFALITGMIALYATDNIYKPISRNWPLDRE